MGGDGGVFILNVRRLHRIGSADSARTVRVRVYRLYYDMASALQPRLS